MPSIPDVGVTPYVGACSTRLQKTCAADTTLLSAGDGGSFDSVGIASPAITSIPMNGVFTSLLAIEMPLMLFPYSSNPAQA